MADFEKAATSGWQDRKKYLKSLLGVEFKRLADSSVVDTAVDARNSIAHGLGKVTGRQRNDPSLAKRLALIDVSVAGGRMYFGVDTLEKVQVGCEGLIRELDRLVVI